MGNGDGRTRIDLSHVVEDGMPTYPGLPGPIVCDYLTRERSRTIYAPGTEFQIGVVTLCSNTGTYVDSPFHRYPDGIDLSELPLDRLADLDAVVVDAPEGATSIGADAFAGIEVAGRAVLVRTGWHRHWRTPAYAVGPPVPDRERSAASGVRRRAARRHRLPQHRRHERRRATRPLCATRRRSADLRAPRRSRAAAVGRVPLQRGSREDEGHGHVSRACLRDDRRVGRRATCRPALRTSRLVGRRPGRVARCASGCL